MITIKNMCSNKFKYDINDMTAFAAKVLGITQNVTVTVVNNDILLNKLSNKDYDIHAFIYRTPIPNMFLLTMRKNVSFPDSVFCHELIHLKQYLDNRLNVNTDNKTYTWMGKIYTNLTPYELRPWESEAMLLASKIMRKFKKENK